MIFRPILTGLAALSLCACSIAPGGFLDKDRLSEKPPTPAQTEALTAKYEVQPIDAEYFRTAVPPTPPLAPCPAGFTCLTKVERDKYQYTIGIHDQVQVIVWDHPELTSGSSSGGGTPPLPAGMGGGGGSTQAAPGGASGGSTSSGGGGGGDVGGVTLRVANDGTIFFPRVGRIKVLGSTAQQVQQAITRGLSRTIRDPQIDVRVVGFNSQQVQILGDVRSPQAQSIVETPLTIIDAINRSGGAAADADLQNVGVTRDGIRHQIDVASILESGNAGQNVVLKDGDIVDVPDRTNSRVFVLGEIAKPAVVPMNRGKLTLADAIATSGSLDNKTSDPHFIYVIRGAEPTPPGSKAALTPVGAKPVPPGLVTTPDIYRLDMTQVDALMLMTKFDLQPRDVVYVQIASSARFNRLLDLITPSLQTLFFTKQLAP
jgi:polysaccharide biosynthesis/export protein